MVTFNTQHCIMEVYDQFNTYLRRQGYVKRLQQKQKIGLEFHKNLTRVSIMASSKSKNNLPAFAHAQENALRDSKNIASM